MGGDEAGDQGGVDAQGSEGGVQVVGGTGEGGGALASGPGFFQEGEWVHGGARLSGGAGGRMRLVGLSAGWVGAGGESGGM